MEGADAKSTFLKIRFAGACVVGMAIFSVVLAAGVTTEGLVIPLLASVLGATLYMFLGPALGRMLLAWCDSEPIERPGRRGLALKPVRHDSRRDLHR